ncbi:DUF3016 domain-containing protein [Undibacterium sp. Di24W]|uniref:DUF3016 domain-containing protein n=1 Tax=Undibacterium sp. Di24W TaxID=3413033 RepID=UPI003BF23F59
MKKLLLNCFSTCVFLGAFSGVAHAGEAKLTWGNLDNFSDISPGYEMKDAFRERLMKEFGLVFSNFAKKLPDGYQLDVAVSDVDLAGDVRPNMSSANQIRFMTSIYWPRMKFHYELRNEKNEVVSVGDEELRDMDYLGRVRIPSGHTSFEYEEKMISDWFRKQTNAGVFPSKDLKAVAAK